MSYKVLQVSEVDQIVVEMEAAEREGYVYVGAVSNPGDSVIIMYREGAVPAEKKELTPGAMSMVRTLLRDAVCTDGGHHKQWYLEQIAAFMEVKLGEHEEGIAP